MMTPIDLYSLCPGPKKLLKLQRVRPQAEAVFPKRDTCPVSAEDLDPALGADAGRARWARWNNRLKIAIVKGIIYL